MKDSEQRERRNARTLYDSLTAYAEGDFYPYHMPGHKRKCVTGVLSDSYGIDITEIDGFDNLHQAEGIIRQAQERAAKLYGSEESFFLVNGSTCGVLAAVLSVTDKQDTVLLARNCHKSVYHAAYLQELHLRYLYPGRIAEYDIPDAVSPEDVGKALEQYPECKAVVITSPTYEGVISNIAKISRVVHAKGKVLIVDEAHGAHLGLSEDMPENAVRLGADLVIHSLHKTLPSMTQTALLHVNGSRVNRAKLRRYLSIFQSSSPSYVLMASMDACISYVQENASACFAKLHRNYNRFIEQIEILNHIRVGSYKAIQRKGYHLAAWDICKLVISVKDTSISGQELYDVLRNEFHLQMEMAAGSYALAVMTIADEEEDWQRLADALKQIDGRIKSRDTETIELMSALADKSCKNGIQTVEKFSFPPVKMTIAQAFHIAQNSGREVPLAQAQGKISGDFVNLYPPGIPILVPGEVIEADTIRYIQKNLELGLHVQGVSEKGTVIEIPMKIWHY